MRITDTMPKKSMKTSARIVCICLTLPFPSLSDFTVVFFLHNTDNFQNKNPLPSKLSGIYTYQVLINWTYGRMMPHNVRDHWLLYLYQIIFCLVYCAKNKRIAYAALRDFMLTKPPSRYIICSFKKSNCFFACFFTYFNLFYHKNATCRQNDILHPLYLELTLEN